MKPSLSHIKLNVADPNFYKDFLLYIGFDMYDEFPAGFGVIDGDMSIWVVKTKAGKDKKLDFEGTGLNHIAFKVDSKDVIDKFHHEFLKPKNIQILHGPKEFKEYNKGKGYYAVFFESPDNIKLEVAWMAE